MATCATADVAWPVGAAVTCARPLLGTIVAIRAEGGDALPTALDAAFAEIEAVHRAMSFHDAASEVSCLNREASRAPQRVGAHLWRVLRAALALAHASGGRFDPAIAGRLVDSGHLPAPQGAPVPHGQACWRDIELLSQHRVRFLRPLWIDLGGIAKGYAVDRAVAVLRMHGVRAGVVNAGGDLRVFGDTNETIRVRDLREPTRTHVLLQLRDGAVATSAGYFSTNVRGSALLDPGSGAHLGGDVSVSVCAPRALWADALTKVVLMDPDAAMPLLRRLRAQAALLNASGMSRILPA